MCRLDIFYQFLGAGSRRVALHDELQEGHPDHKRQNSKGELPKLAKTFGVALRPGVSRSAAAELIN
jgi:hypothetical protein